MYPSASPARRREKTNRGIPFPRLRQDVQVECRVIRLHREAAATHRDDLAWIVGHIVGWHPPRECAGGPVYDDTPRGQDVTSRLCRLLRAQLVVGDLQLRCAFVLGERRQPALDDLVGRLAEAMPFCTYASIALK